MKKELVKINQCDISVKEYQGQRVVTLKDIDLCHNRPEGTARRSFNSNKQHFIEGEDYFKICANEIRTHNIMKISPKTREDITFLTESGYLMLVKSFTDDLAWQVQRQLVNSYFRVQKSKADDTHKIQAQQERAHAMLLNAQCRMFKTIMSVIDDKNLSPIAKQVFGITALETATGTPIEYRPECEKTYTATQLGDEFGVSANKIGKLANANNLKTAEYGLIVMDKSRYSSKEVEAFRYNEKGRAKLKELLSNTIK